jgi:Tol biopolymer transport system component
MLLIAGLFAAGAAFAATTERVSVATDGSQANGASRNPAVSCDGRYVAFTSSATNLVVGDDNQFSDVFVRDRVLGETTRASVASDGTEANDRSYSPTISCDGHYVAFYSYADNLVGDDDNDVPDVFLRDRVLNETIRVSLGLAGAEADGYSSSPAISADGNHVAFESRATNLILGDDNGRGDVFVYDVSTGDIVRVSVDSDGNQVYGSSDDPVISADGRYVAFISYASDLVPNDTNGQEDLFLHDRLEGVTIRVNVASDGTQANYWTSDPAISGDGSHVGFYTEADSLVPDDDNGDDDVFVRDVLQAETERVSVNSQGEEADGGSRRPSICGTGRYVAFESWADNLVPDDDSWWDDVFVRDRQQGETIRVSVDSDGIPGNYFSGSPSLTSDGLYVAFESSADNLVPGDDNDAQDIFLRGPLVDPEVLIVGIDIAWQRDPNQLNPDAGKVQVAILTEPATGFDAADVDPESARFGPWQAHPLSDPDRSRMRDVDGDGDDDLLLFFETGETGIVCGDTTATLTAEKTDGQSIEGTDAVVPVGCHL